jgi:hypothetical protein
MEMKRTALSALFVFGMLSFGIWTGRTSAAFAQSDQELLDDMNHAVKEAAQEREILFLREMVRREMAMRMAMDSQHQYGGKPCRTAD